MIIKRTLRGPFSLGECERGLGALGDEFELDAGEGVVQLA